MLLSDDEVGLALSPPPGTPVPASGALSDDQVGLNASPPPAAGPGLLSDEDVGVSPNAKPGALALGLQGLLRGASESGTNTTRTLTGGAFQDQPEPAPATDPLSQSLGKTFFKDRGYADPSWYASHVGYGLGSSAPGLALGVAGAAAGGAVAPEAGPFGPILGGALGMGLGSALPAVSSGYRDARARGLDPDAAADQALKTAGVSGLTGFAMGATGGLGRLFESSFIRGAGGAITVRAPIIQGDATTRALTSVPGQALVTQPAIGAVGQQAEGLATGQQPTAEDYAAGYVTNAVTGGAFALAHRGPTPGRTAPFRGEPPAPPEPGPALIPGAPAPDAPARTPVMGPPPEPVQPTPAEEPRSPREPFVGPVVPVEPQPPPNVIPPAEPPAPPPVSAPGPVPVPAPAPAPSTDPTGNDGTPLPVPTPGPAPVADPGAAPPAGPVQPGAPAPGAPGDAQGVRPPAVPGIEGPGPGAPAGDSPAAPAAPAPAPVAPKRETVSTATGRKVDTEFQVVDAKDLVAASGDLQPRDRAGRASSDAQIAKISSDLDPSRLHSSPEADRGAPIVGSDNVVESGNGRTAAIRQAYARGGAQADAYRQMIVDQGHTIPDGMAEPILVRRRLTEMDTLTRQKFVDESNVDSTARMSPAEQATTDARSLSHDMLGKLNPDLSGGVLAAGNRDFVRHWMSTVPESQRGALQDAVGGLSVEGQRRLQSAIVARAYDDKGTLQRMLERTDDNTKSITGALTDAAPAMAGLKAGIEAGRVPAALDISSDLIRAADLVKVSRDNNQAPADILNQGDVFNPMTPLTQALVRVFHDPNMRRPAGRARIANVLKQYAIEAGKQGNADLAGGTKLDPAAYIQRALDKAAPDAPDAQGGLFAPAKPPTPQSADVPEPGKPSADISPSPEPPAPAPAPEPVDPKAAQLAKLDKSIEKARADLAKARSGDRKITLAGQIAKLEAQRDKLRGSVDKAKPPAAPAPLPAPVPVPVPKAPAPTPGPEPKVTTSQFKQPRSTEELHKAPATTPETVHAKAAAWLVGLGDQDGNEHVVFVDNVTGKIVHASTDHRPAAVGFFVPLNTPDSYALHHNHPRDTALSPDDIHLLQYPAISHVAAHGTRNSYNATLTNKGLRARLDRKLTGAVLERAVKKAEDQIQLSIADAMRQGKVSITQRDQHFYDMVHRLAAADTKLYHFQSSRPILPAFQEAFDAALRQVGVAGSDLGRHALTVGREDQIAAIHRDAQRRSALGRGSAQGAGAADRLADRGDGGHGPAVVLDDTRDASGNKLDTLDDNATNALASRASGDSPAQGSAAGSRGGDGRTPPVTPSPIAALPAPGYRPDVAGAMPRDPHYTQAPSTTIRQTMAELGIRDPDGVLSKPAAAQVHILRQATISKYGLKAIEVHPRANPRETIDQLADAHQNLQAMAHVMGVPNDTIGLQGKLSLWLGPRGAAEVSVGGGEAMGVYRPDNQTIYMPGRSNSFAHEWTHALDHQLVQALGVTPGRLPLLSTSPDAWARAPAGSSQAAFAQVMGSIFGKDAGTTLAYLAAQERAARMPTPANARALQQARAAYRASDFYVQARAVGGAFSSYLTQPYEMLARSHEAYLSNRISTAGSRNSRGEFAGDTQFVSKQEAAYLSTADRAMNAQYPKGPERMAIFAAWDALHGQLRQDALYPRGAPASLPRDDLGGLGPSHWGQWGNPAANPALAARLAARVRGQTQATSKLAEALHRLGIDASDGSDPGYLTKWARHADGFRGLTFSPRGMMNVIHDRVPARARPALRSLIDQITTDPGSGRHVAQTYEEQVHNRSRRDNNQYAALAQRHGVTSGAGARMDDQARAQVHEMMTQSEDVSRLPERIQKAIRDNTLARLSVPEQNVLRRFMAQAAPAGTPTNIKQFASDLRFMLDQRYYDLRQAGFEIPYTDGYFPRLFDDARIYADPAGFEADARRVLEIRSDRETEDDGDELVSRFRSLRDDIDPGVGDDIHRAISAQRRVLRQTSNALQVPTAADLVPDPAHRDAIHQAWARERAAAWRNQVMVGHATRYDTRGPAGDALKGRVLPPEADSILRRWLITDPHAVVPAYMHQTNRKIAFAERFGQTGRAIDDAIQRAVDMGMRPEDGDEMRRLVENVTGRPVGSNKYPKAVVRTLEHVHAFGTMALMPRAVFSAISEPMAVLARTGSVRATWEGFAQLVREMGRTADSHRVSEIANYIGTVTHAMFESTQSDRTGATYTDAQQLNTMMVNYFRRTGLTSITNAQRRGAVVSASFYLHSLADTLNDNSRPGYHQDRTQENARAQLRDLGIPDSEHAGFARWLGGIEGVPNISELKGNRMGDAWGAAVGRFVDQVNQDPKASEKPMMSSDPFGRLTFGLMSFNYSFFPNVVERFFKDAHRQMHNAPGAGRKTGVLARLVLLGTASVATMWAGQMLSSALRESIFNSTSVAEHADKGDLAEWLADLAFNRIGLNGPLDPVIQAISSLKYNKSVSDLVIGAQAGWVADNLQKMLSAVVGKTSPHTNTATYNGLVGAYNLLAAPAAAMALTAIPGGPMVSGLASGAMMYATSKGAADTAATALVGPKGSGDETTEPRDEAEPKDDEGEDKKEDTGGGLGGSAMGLVDDFLPVAARNFGRVPFVGRVAAGVAAGAYVGSSLADEFSRYTQPPPGKR